MNTTEYVLVCLMEECAEVQHAAAKALRFGLPLNREQLQREILDVQAIVELLQESGILAIAPDAEGHLRAKKKKVLACMEADNGQD